MTSRVALVTGGTGGIGTAICKRLVDMGHRVATNYRDEARARAWQQAMATEGYPVTLVPGDVASTESAQAMVRAVEAQLGPVEILVNNAGITRDNLFMRMKDDDWDAVIAVNLTAAFRLSRAAVKGMMRRRHGRIVNIGSVVGTTGNPGQGNYAAAKAGLVGLTKALAAEVASRNITVNCIAPGCIASPMTDELNEKQREGILSRVPAGRLGQGDEVAAAAVYLASNEAAYVTGHTLHVNGGMAMV